MDDVYASKPWLKSYDRSVPHTLTYPRVTYPEYARDAFQKVPERAALYYMGKSITFRELDSLSNRFARFLISHDCHAGDVVGVHLPNIPACYIALLGIQKAGCVYTGINVLLTPGEIEYQLKDSGAKVLVTLDVFFAKVSPVVHKTEVKTIIAAAIADFLPALKRTLGKLLHKIPSGKVTPVNGVNVTKFMDIVCNNRDDPPSVRISPEDPCLMMYTGGTTGPPKGAILTHNNIVHHMVQMREWVGLRMGEDLALSAFPMFHQAGNFIGMWAIVMGGPTVLIPDPRNLKHIIASIRKYRPTIIVNVPTIYMELMKVPEFSALDFSTVKFFISGASPFPAEYIKKFEKIVGEGKVIEVLGMTETSPVITALPYRGIKKAGSVGIPIIDTDVKIVNPESGEVAPMGEAGELIAKGPQVFTEGYHKKPEETANTLRNGWIYTGDICRMDEDGYIYVEDRLKDVVNLSGFKVFTRMVDDILVEHPDVENAATIGLADPERPGSEIVASAVVLKKGKEKGEETKKSITAYMRERVAPYKVPKIIEFMDELPMSAIGKVLKRELRKVMEVKKRE